jgi:glycosyltransferase involved in cell wall biosynthesis
LWRGAIGTATDAMASPKPISVTVVIPSHNPDLGRLQETLRGLKVQTLGPNLWEVLLVDNASAAFPSGSDYAASAPQGLRVIREPRLGLTSARLAGILASRGSTIVFVDDDNVLSPTYLEEVARVFSTHPRLGAAGGKSIPVFEIPVAAWQEEFLDLLALRDLGEAELVATTFRPEGMGQNQYPSCAPIGAGMALRREAALAWVEAIQREPSRLKFDRTGTELVSGGDNDIVMVILENGWSVGYFPSLSLKHLVPRTRLETSYLARLNRAIQRSWVQVLALHGANPWKPIPRWTVPLRNARAYFHHRAWQSPETRVRWHGICGRNEGLASI